MEPLPGGEGVMALNGVWVLLGDAGQHPAGVYTSRDRAEKDIAKHGLTGMLTLQPVDELTYDWAIRNKYFSPSKDYQTSARFIQRFSTASAEHFRYEAGKRVEYEA